ncbi:hypothetical protein JZ751_015442, partial [Albula glossodonta]
WGVACDLCTEGRVRAVKFCMACTASYCETHVRQHYTVPALQRHTLEEAPADLQPELCPQHHRALELFCNTDRTLICGHSKASILLKYLWQFDEKEFKEFKYYLSEYTKIPKGKVKDKECDRVDVANVMENTLGKEGALKIALERFPHCRKGIQTKKRCP